MAGGRASASRGAVPGGGGRQTRAKDEPRLPGRPVGADGDETRERILEKAIELFAECGFSGAPVRDLACRARIRVSSLYHYFPSKEALYEAVQERMSEQLREITLSVVSKGTDLRDMAREAIGRLFDFYIAHPAYIRLGYRLYLDGSPVHAYRRVTDRWIGLMEGLMKFAEHQGILKPVEPALLLVSVEGLLAAHLANDVLYRGFYGKGLDDPALAARVRDHVIQMVVRTVGLD